MLLSFINFYSFTSQDIFLLLRIHISKEFSPSFQTDFFFIFIKYHILISKPTKFI